MTIVKWHIERSHVTNPGGGVAETFRVANPSDSDVAETVPDTNPIPAVMKKQRLNRMH